MSIFLFTYVYINIYSKNGHDPLSPLFCYSWINKILSVNVPLCSSIDVISWLL